MGCSFSVTLSASEGSLQMRETGLMQAVRTPSPFPSSEQCNDTYLPKAQERKGKEREQEEGLGWRVERGPTQPSTLGTLSHMVGCCSIVSNIFSIMMHAAPASSSLSYCQIMGEIVVLPGHFGTNPGIYNNVSDDII